MKLYLAVRILFFTIYIDNCCQMGHVCAIFNCIPFFALLANRTTSLSFFEKIDLLLFPDATILSEYVEQ